MKIQWFCRNIHANSGYSDEARVFIKGLHKLGHTVIVIGRNKHLKISSYQFYKKSDSRLPIIYHTYRHGDYEINSPQFSIVRTMLEVSHIPQSWVYLFNQMDDVWVPNQFNLNTFINSGVHEEKISIIPSPVDIIDPNHIIPHKVKTRKKFKFFSLFNYEARDRKGLDILLKAYTEMFTHKDDVCLLIKSKTSLADLKREYGLSDLIPELEIINKVLTRNELLGIYKTANCFVLPSRGEGIGRPLLDAMVMGTPIITTNWSGQADYLNETNAFLIDYKLVDVDTQYYLKYPGFYGSSWAEPDIDDLKYKMKTIFQNKQFARAKTQQASSDVKQYQEQKIVSQIIQRLENPRPFSIKARHLQSSVFHNLYPIYYPKISCQTEVGLRSSQDFKRPISALALAGNGYHLHRALHTLSANQTIKKIYHLNLNNTAAAKSPLASFPNLDIEEISKKVDIVVLAAKLSRIPQIYRIILAKVDSLPLYVYS